jgi:Tfp pilus assembly protein PilF
MSEIFVGKLFAALPTADTFSLALQYRQSRDLAQAERLFWQVIQADASHSEAWRELGLTCLEMGKLADAEAALRQATSLAPGNAAAHNDLGIALAQQKKLDQAEQSFREALRLAPQMPAGHSNLGLVLMRQTRLDEAIASLQRATELAPNIAEAHNDLGEAQCQIGDLARAEISFRQAARRDPRYLRMLAFLLDARLPDHDVHALRGLLAAPELPDSERSQVHYALTRVYDARGKYAEAAQHAQRANALDRALCRTRGQVDYSAANPRFVEFVKSTFTPDFFRRVRGWGVESEVPVFVFGLPRSGTTLVEQILASHSRVHGAGELALSGDAILSLTKKNDGARRVTEKDVQEAFSLLATKPELVRRVALDCLDHLQRFDRATARTIDKMPGNYLYLGLLAVLFPRARFIHCRRDLRDVALSCWLTSFEQLRWANDQEAILSHFQMYRQLMAHWRQVLPVSILEVSYEDLVANLENEARRLIAGCGLEWEPACLTFHKTRRAVHTASFSQVRQPIYSRSVGRWRHYAEALGPLLTQLDADHSMTVTVAANGESPVGFLQDPRGQRQGLDATR